MKNKKASNRKKDAYSFACPKCGKVEQKSGYCVAQQAMGYTVTFTCECKHRFEVHE